MDLVLDGPGGNERVTVHGAISANDFSFLREVIIAGFGIGLLPWFRAATDVAQGRLVRYPSIGSRARPRSSFTPLRRLPAKTRAFKRFLLTHGLSLVVAPDEWTSSP